MNSTLLAHSRELDVSSYFSIEVVFKIKKIITQHRDRIVKTHVCRFYSNSFNSRHATAKEKKFCGQRLIDDEMHLNKCQRGI